MSKADKRENIIMVRFYSPDLSLYPNSNSHLAQIASEPLTFEKGHYSQLKSFHTFN